MQRSAKRNPIEVKLPDIMNDNTKSRSSMPMILPAAGRDSTVGVSGVHRMIQFLIRIEAGFVTNI